MTRRTNEFKMLAYTPYGLLDPAIAIAASRAGAIGILNLESAADERLAMAAVSKLAQHCRNECGIKLDGNAKELLTCLIPRLTGKIKTIVLTATDRASLKDQVVALHELGLTVLIEAVDLEQARAGEAAGVDGLIAKGNESGGWVREETTLILLQRLLANTNLPVLAHGGIGLHTAAACFAAGAEGLILDSQLLLTRESSVPAAVKAHISRMDGSETVCFGTNFGIGFRAYARPGMKVIEDLQKVTRCLEDDPNRTKDTWRQQVDSRVGWDDLDQQLCPLGQDAAFAAPLAKQFQTVAGIIQGFRQSIEEHLRAAKSLRPLDQGSALARSHKTVYPIVQGPMTRVSDTAVFAAEVANNGALPFLALALMRAAEARTLLKETQNALGDKPWGVGILGFVPLELREEQLEVILSCRPPFALIAGGRPDQSLLLEQAGIPTYLHVPSPGLLKQFIENGARRFVLEGRECGGHVGPRSSFVLWNMMVDVLLQSLNADEIASCHVLFAGGIHDDVSSSMVATVAAPLAARGAKVGVLLGTAYLFTKEAVESGAIVEGFQKEAIDCTRTVLLESGPGHATRCAETAFVGVFEKERQELLANNKSADEIRHVLEHLNVGRLRIASKAVDRHPGYGQDPNAPRFIEMNHEQQQAQGMYMIGQLAALRSSTCTIADLHRDLSVSGSERLTRLPEQIFGAEHLREQKPCDAAIIGMACMMPKAPNLERYWENILNKVDAVTEVPKHRWDWSQYYDPDPKTRDKVNSKWGGFLEEVPFDPIRYGIPPSTIPSIEPVQLLTLEVVRAALEDAGYIDKPFARSRTSVVFGMGGGAADLSQKYSFRAWLPSFIKDENAALSLDLPEWTSDSFAGTLMSVAAGRIANRFDLGGVNYTVDAACASSLAALDIATRELESGTSDMVIVGGVDTDQCPVAYMGFSKTQTLSGQGRCRTFDESADGIAISEGVAVVVLKRLADAERDGDRIYAVVKAVGGSSDGRDKSLTAPRPEGQAVALERAYAKANLSPASVSLIEAHGTGTPAGDPAETETLKRVFEAAGAERQSCAIGSVKSMIGHTKRAAGAAGLIKVAKALYHKILPPTIHVEKPNSKIGFPESPFYVNTETRPWVESSPGQPRRAGVSAFGFGGTNFHAVLEEYSDDFVISDPPAASNDWPAELFLWSRSSREQLLETIGSIEQLLAGTVTSSLRDLAYTLWQAWERRHPACISSETVRWPGRQDTCAPRPAEEDSNASLAIVASSIDDLRQKLSRARAALQRSEADSIVDHTGIYFSDRPIAKTGKLAFLFPGQGSQYPGMLADLAVHFPEVREQIERADRALAGKFNRKLSSYIFPPPGFSADEKRSHEQALTDTRVAQPAIGASSLALMRLYKQFGLEPEMVAGHSYGEYVALCSAGVLSEESLYLVSEARGRAINECAADEPGAMAAVLGGAEEVSDELKSTEHLWVANFNAPRQTVISGSREAVSRAIERLTRNGIQARAIQVACAFHTPMVAGAKQRLATVLSAIDWHAPRLKVFSNMTAQPYADEPSLIPGLLEEHLISPVRFSEEIQQMYAAGARAFVEVGPRNVLTGLTDQILSDQPHLTVASDVPGRPGMVQLLHVLGHLAVHGFNVNLDRLFKCRSVTQLSFDTLGAELRNDDTSTSVWLIDGGRARPARDAAPKRQPVSEDMRVQLPATFVQESPMDRTPEKDKQVPPQSSSFVGERSHQVEVDNIPAGNGQSSAAFSQHAPNGEIGEVMAGFQQLMNSFLETQRKVMLAYFQGSNGQSFDAVESFSSIDSLHARTAPVSAGILPAACNSAVCEEGRQDVCAPRAIETVSSAASQAPSERDTMAATLIEVVSERTGYPAEMLTLDINLEADLGIDSIKHVEIIGTMRKRFAPVHQQRVQDQMEMLVRAKTLRAILDFLAPAAEADKTQSPESASAREQTSVAHTEVETAVETEAKAEATLDVARFVLKPIKTGAPTHEPITTNGVFLITDDERGIAPALAARLESQERRAVVVRRGNCVLRLADGIYSADVTDRQHVSELVDLVRKEEGRIAALVHLLPLSESIELEQMSLVDWQGRAHLEVKSLFHLTQAVTNDLRQKVETDAGRLLAATWFGSTTGEDGTARQAFSPVSAGVAGFVKTLAIEWPDVACQAAHLDQGDSIARLVEQLMQEITGGREPEVVYRNGERLILQSEKMPLEQRESVSAMIDSESVLLITGGARGITAAVATDLARQYRPTLLLIGRSALPAPQESADTAKLTTPREIKAALIEQFWQQGESLKPAHVEAEYARLMRDREIRHNLSAMRQAGARVHYYQVDVRDGIAFEQVIKNVYQEFGRLDGVIHGAGIIEDKLVEDKTPESFDRVFDTKVTGAFVLARNLRRDTRFLIFFSSVSGSYGNRGQSDYAAANEVLNKLAIYLDAHWPGRVVSINWGPWEGLGMVSEEIRRQLAHRGIQMISPEAGIRALDKELRLGSKGEVQVVLGSGPWATSRSGLSASA